VHLVPEQLAWLAVLEQPAGAQHEERVVVGHSQQTVRDGQDGLVPELVTQERLQIPERGTV